METVGGMVRLSSGSSTVVLGNRLSRCIHNRGRENNGLNVWRTGEVGLVSPLDIAERLATGLGTVTKTGLSQDID
jgi:hypothetical protein